MESIDRQKKVYRQGSVLTFRRQNSSPLPFDKLLMYSYTLHLKLSKTQILGLCSVERQAKHIRQIL